MGPGPLVYSAIAMGAAVPDALEVTIRRLEPGDVPGLVRCCGDHCPYRAFSAADEVRSSLSRERLHSAVALDELGEVVAHLGVVLERRGARTGDMGLGIVDSRFRGTPQWRRPA